MQFYFYSLEGKRKSLKKKLRCHENKTISFIEIVCGFDWF